MTLELHPNARVIQKLYVGIKNADPGIISECYAEGAYFEDIAFRRYGKTQITEMWKLVCHSRPEVKILSLSADDDRGVGSWNAKYRFGKTDTKPGRPVNNTLSSKFVFADGRIIEHRDYCDAMAWARQAFPFPVSLAAGWIGPLRRYMATRKLNKFLKEAAPNALLQDNPTGRAR